MHKRFSITLLILLFAGGLFAQQPALKGLRIVDTLSTAEKNTRNPIILRTELDSLINLHMAALVPQQVDEPVKETVNQVSIWLMPLVIVIALLAGLLVYLFYRQHQKINTLVNDLNERATEKISVTTNTNGVAVKEKKGKLSQQSLEIKISDLNIELNKLLKENEGLNRVLKEYNGIQHEYESLRHGLLKAYKVQHYPGYDKSRQEYVAMQGVLETENAVATYAYEKFLKPVLAITDTNKNSPARISKEDQEKLLDLLLSLSLLYIEYLYLRVNELSIGGNMVQRIQSFGKGSGIDPSLLKKLNTEFGSRALVVKMVLEKAQVHHLSYPVFDETNLNNK